MITKYLSEIVSEIFGQLKYAKGDEYVVSLSDRVDVCDYQCNDLFKLSKLYKKSPSAIGDEFIAELNKNATYKKLFSKVEIFNPGFLNFSLSAEFIFELQKKMFARKGLIDFEDKKKVVMDYGGPNIAKPLHVGHLRSAVVGESIKRILRHAGNTVIADVHFGDFGLQMGQVIYGIKEKGIKLEELTLNDLDEIYPNMSGRCKEDEALLSECAELAKRQQDGDKELKEYWEKIVELSKVDIKKQYDYLDVAFDIWEGESDAEPLLAELTKELEQKGVLEISQGAKIINVAREGEEMPPLLYQKSNGAYLYGTTDLGTIKKRYINYKPDEIIYVADKRQSLHFEQVFRAAEKGSIAPNVKLELCGFGTVNGKDGKPFKTRAGSAPKLSALFEEVREVVCNLEQNKTIKGEDADILVNAILKFADLQNNIESDYIFDIEKFSNVVGKTGPYVLYTYARINSVVVNEVWDSKIDSLAQIYNDSDRSLRIHILKFEEYFAKAYSGRKPNILCEYLYNLCLRANTFYEQNRIKDNSDEAQKAQWLSVLQQTTKLIKLVSHLLVIEQPSVMSKK